MTLKVILTSPGYQFRVFPSEDAIAGKTAPIGSGYVTINDLCETNITGAVVLESDRSTHWHALLYAELRKLGVKFISWHSLTPGGEKHLSRKIVCENCTEDEVRYYRALIDLDRARA